MKLLLVDDNVSVREELRQAIELKTTFEVVGEAADGLEAVRSCRSSTSTSSSWTSGCPSWTESRPQAHQGAEAECLRARPQRDRRPDGCVGNPSSGGVRLRTEGRASGGLSVTATRGRRGSGVPSTRYRAPVWAGRMTLAIVSTPVPTATST